MGSPADEADRGDDEGPQVRVKVEPFWIGKVRSHLGRVPLVHGDVRCIQENAAPRRQRGLRRSGRDDKDLRAHPSSRLERQARRRVERRCRHLAHAAIRFLVHVRRRRPTQPAGRHDHAVRRPAIHKWLSGITGQRLSPADRSRVGIRGPRRHDDTPSRSATTPRKLEDYAWIETTATTQTHPVGTKKPNPWGLHDMHGNVAEWTLDRIPSRGVRQARRRSRSMRSPPSAGRPKYFPRVIRGGSWLEPPAMSSQRRSPQIGRPGVEAFRSEYPAQPLVVHRRARDRRRHANHAATQAAVGRKRRSACGKPTSTMSART